jgi:hypothetical protein
MGSAIERHCDSVSTPLSATVLHAPAPCANDRWKIRLFALATETHIANLSALTVDHISDREKELTTILSSSTARLLSPEATVTESAHSNRTCVLRVAVPSREVALSGCEYLLSERL